VNRGGKPSLVFNDTLDLIEFEPRVYLLFYFFHGFGERRDLFACGVRFGVAFKGLTAIPMAWRSGSVFGGWEGRNLIDCR